MTENNENREVTTIRVRDGQDIDLTHNENGPIRVLVMRNDTGSCGYQDVDAGATAGDVVGNTEGQQIRVNGEPAQADRPLQNNDRVSTTPEKVEGN